jgi:hypothetical protein
VKRPQGLKPNPEIHRVKPEPVKPRDGGGRDRNTIIDRTSLPLELILLSAPALAGRDGRGWACKHRLATLRAMDDRTLKGEDGPDV